MPETIANTTAGRIGANLVRLLGGKAAAGLIGLGTMAIAARTLGPRDFGVLVLIHTFAMTVGGIIEFPGWHAIVRYGAEARAAGDTHRLARLLRFAGGVEIVGGVASIVVAAVVGHLFGASLGWSPVAVAFAVPYSFAVLASIRATPAGYLQLMGRFDLLGIHSIVSPAVRLGGAALVAAHGGGLHAFLVVWLAAALAEWAAMWLLGAWVARAALAGTPLLGPIDGVHAENPGLWRFMLAANADVTFSELSARIAPLILGAVLGPAAAGLFNIAQRATTVISQPAQILGQAAYAELARLVASGERGEALRAAVAKCVTVAVVASLPVIALIAGFGGEIATILGGPAFAGAAGVMLWLGIARVVLLVGPPSSAALTALGRPGLSVLANVVASLGTLPLLPLLLAVAGLTGAGWHALAQAVAAAALLAWFTVRESGERPALSVRPA